jgi:hypothetical protein
MIGRFIIEGDPACLEVAKQAIEYLHENPDQPNVLSTAPGFSVIAVRLKKSIRVRQVKP